MNRPPRPRRRPTEQNRRLGGATLLGLLGVLLATACGGAPAPRRAEAPSEPEPQSVDEAEAQIARARDALRVSAEPPTPGASPAAQSETGGVRAPTSDAEPEAKKDHSRAAETGGDRECSAPCRALASMRRAVTALCRMTGPDDARCNDARRTLTESETRAGRCDC